ncbi:MULTISPECIES: SPW repeat protein [Priestia]|nr:MULTISPECIES: SPW repeat protein [Priestia]MBY0091944.1 SPW repeat protein [Priestia aryabhattai]MBY0099852.1 SPW repeat protein [Priestia aryabhattai]MCM3304301.1 SPW repeat protein [Priestia megaterium]MED4026397.1 SPW repeat protein [Priestia megaterium]MED4138953.1 SPW repeat protein [Priestia megaterium]
MKTRGIINAIIGIWFVIAPWMLGFSYDAGATSASIVFGILQVITSLLGANKSGWNSWQNWISLISGLWFVLFPFIYSLTDEVLWSSIILGLMTGLFSLWSLNSKLKLKAVS